MPTFVGLVVVMSTMSGYPTGAIAGLGLGG